MNKLHSATSESVKQTWKPVKIENEKNEFGAVLLSVVLILFARPKRKYFFLLRRVFQEQKKCYLVDPASSHMLV